MATLKPAAKQRERPIWWIVDEVDKDRARAAAQAAKIPRVAIAWLPTGVEYRRVRMILIGMYQALVAHPKWPSTGTAYQWLAESDFFSRGSTFRALTVFHQACEHISYINGSISLAKLREKAAGKTCWCLAGGPSLDRRLELIKNTQDKCFILAADIVAGRLHKAGVRVDAVLTLDRHMRDWFRADLPEETVIIGNFNAVPEIMAKFPRRSYILPEDLANRYGVPDNFSILGSNVGVSLLSVAAALNVAEIIVGGLDLATEGNYYSQLVENNTEKTADILQKGRGA